MRKTKLSVNLNKVALIRNSRGGNYPDLVKVAMDCEQFGADGITIHPRPDERHAKYSDIPALKQIVKTELNIEGYPSDRFMKIILNTRPHQCTLVPDPPDALTSDTGWDTRKHQNFLKEICNALKEEGIRSSVFINPDPGLMESAKMTGADRIELYTGPYAKSFDVNPENAVQPYREAARTALEYGLEINAGHDLNLRNLRYFIQEVPEVAEVSIGHALVTDALYYGLQNTIHLYINCL
ncbi:MAG TPA: pyridoxine 5'-phosphate synthase [Saprospiraceae bacterium]|nr:pyridoxine 5'-phosphate synthase [Saprospiraceae bacterium]